MDDNENTFIDSDGTRYEAIPFDESEDDNGEGHCGRCEFDGNCLTINCCAYERRDRQDVYWLKHWPTTPKTIELMKDPNPL